MKRRIISALVVATAILVPVSVLAVLMGAWLQYVGNPVIPLGKKGTWDDKSLNSARVVYDGASYRMWYAASGSINSRAKIGYAISADGLKRRSESSATADPPPRRLTPCHVITIVAT